MHTGARARKQKYISIYISLYMKTFLKTGVYIYIYILYAKPSNKRFIILLQNVILQLAYIFWVRVFRNILIPSVRMTSTMSKMFARIICETVE